MLGSGDGCCWQESANHYVEIPHRSPHRHSQPSPNQTRLSSFSVRQEAGKSGDWRVVVQEIVKTSQAEQEEGKAEVSI
jgi:hypothetical protein